MSDDQRALVDVVRRVVEANQVHGGSGLTDEFPVPRYLRGARFVMGDSILRRAGTRAPAASRLNSRVTTCESRLALYQ